MHSLLSLSAVLSLAITTTSSQLTSITTTVTLPLGPPGPAGPPVRVSTTTNLCPVETVFINVTETDTATIPITVFQTVISTTTSTRVETVTEVATSPTTATVTTPITETATATEIISQYQSTTQGTSLKICPSRIVNPTYTASGPYPTDWTWGCPPGWLCKPILDNCNFEAGLPDPNFLCSPNECIPAEEIPAVLPSWDVDIYGNSTPATNPALKLNTIDDFFNMNPIQFGLSYDIFVFNEVFTRTTTILEQPSPTVAARQAQTSVPGACYPWCNNCLLEAQSNGKTSKLCVPGSAFMVSIGQCEQCIDYHKSDGTGTFVQIAPQFQQFLDYCGQFSTIAVSTTVTTTTTNAAGSSYTVVTGTLSPTVTPKGSAAPSPSLSQSSSVVTVVASTATMTQASNTSLSTTWVSVTPTIPTVSSSASTPPAPVASQHPYTTTETVTTTTYSLTTVSGSAWSSITIIMTVGNNSSTTMYGSSFTSGEATVVLPISPTTSTYTTTITVTPGGQVSAVSTGGSSALSVAAASRTAGASQSNFTGSASSLRLSGGGFPLRTTVVGLFTCMVAMLML